MHRCSCGRHDGFSSLEIAALMMVGLVVILVVVAPHLAAASAGGALTGAGVNVLAGAMGRNS